ncbi:MAG: TetR/AcrR family transcriptional regulator [Acholeplasmataceae bacterium]|jgi:AcrR family transcriptional regulator|nr:TetR/AcrR family transcriptional regulator [Acholeplasmataceae bacterium]
MASTDIKRKMIENTKILLKDKASITIKDIADASYVNIAAVNYHFGSKENLMRIVLEEIMESLKTYVTEELILLKDDRSFEEKLEMMINYIYNFAIDNVGLLNYLFLSNELQKDSSSLLIDQFFTDNQFTRVVYQSLAESTKTMNEVELQAKYILLFSSFCIPLFIQISQMKLQGKMKIELFKDPEFRQTYIKSIMKIMS